MINPIAVQKKESSLHSLGIYFIVDTVESIIDFLHRVKLALPLTQPPYQQVTPRGL